ncbi:MAG: hypothetical protein WCO48_02845 [Candidatus Taylorbacteria bacterium]
MKKILNLSVAIFSLVLLMSVVSGSQNVWASTESNCIQLGYSGTFIPKTSGELSVLFVDGYSEDGRGYYNNSGLFTGEINGIPITVDGANSDGTIFGYVEAGKTYQYSFSGSAQWGPGINANPDGTTDGDPNPIRVADKEFICYGTDIMGKTIKAFSLVGLISSSVAPVPTVYITARIDDHFKGSKAFDGDTATLSWNATDATSCTASGDWSGIKNIEGSENIGPFYKANTPPGGKWSYFLKCTGAGGDGYGETSVSPAVSSSEIIAKKLGLTPFNVRSIGVAKGNASEDGKILLYAPGSIPILGKGEVLVKGLYSTINGEDQSTFYVVNKSNLPDGYILSAEGEINTGGFQPTDRWGSPIISKKNVAFYTLADLTTVAIEDSQKNFTILPKENDSSLGLALKLAIAVQSLTDRLDSIYQNDSVSALRMALTIGRYLKGDADYTPENPILSSFKNYGSQLAQLNPSTYVGDIVAQTAIEKAAVDYVNNSIKSFVPVGASVENSLVNAVAIGQGVCRDKSAALVATLTSAGVNAALVVAPGHVFVAVLDSAGNVDHYLDPMFYENYIALARPSVPKTQIIQFIK